MGRGAGPVPAPDSLALEGGSGFARWTGTDEEIAAADLSVRDGRVVQLTVRPSASVAEDVLEDLALSFAATLGPAAPNGFHETANWDGLDGGPPRLTRRGVKLQVGMFVADRVLVLRLTPGSR